ncbi:MAG: glycosyltransferase family 4 protein [Candidatus Omnitrophica bacterium]|nr:glycosyltransferase family 4 protein [Candidatus Omnitrophota bacterium]
MKYLFVNQAFYPDTVSTAQHLTDIAVKLTRAGHSVTVLTARSSYSSDGMPYPKTEEYKGIRIKRVASFSVKRNFKTTRILQALFLQLTFAWNLLWMDKVDCVVALTSPPLVAWIALWFARRHRSRFVYWVMDLNPDQAIAMRWLREDSMSARLLNQVLISILHKSEHIIALDQYMKRRLVAKGVNPGLVTELPPWSHDEDLELVDHGSNPFRTKHGLGDKFVVMYSGNLSICHPLDTLLQAALRARNNDKIFFMFIGAGERVKEVLDFKYKHQLENIKYLPYQQRVDIKYSLSAADLHVVSMGDNMVGIVHPCKIYGILKLGKPFLFIGPQKSHIGDIVDRYGLGYRVEHGAANKALEIIERAKGLTQHELEHIKIKEQMLAQDFSFERLIERMSLVLAVSHKQAESGPIF